MAILSFRRYEKKFLVTAEQEQELLKIFAEHFVYDKYCIDNKRYRICNLYFDTEQDDVIRHSISRPYYKEKFRIRSYDTPTDDSPVYLEIKKKANGTVLKRRAKMTLAQSHLYMQTGERPPDCDFMKTQVLNEIDYYLRCNPVRPKVYISYDRIALFDKENKNFRVTFDTNIRTRRDDLFLEHGNHGNLLIPETMRLMEIKSDRNYPLWLAQLLSDMNIRNQRFSKYGTEYKQYITGGSSHV